MLSALCIRRPVMTILVMASFVIAGIFGYQAAARRGRAARRLPDHPGHGAAAGRQPRDHGRLGRLDPRAAVLDHRRRHVDDLDLVARQHLDRAAVRPQPQHRWRRARRAVGDLLGACAACRPTCRRRRASARSIRPTTPIMFLALKSSQVRLSDVDAFANRAILPRISTLPGIAQVLIFGSQKYAVRVRADLDQLAVRGLTLHELQTAIVNANSNKPVGAIADQRQSSILDATGPINKAADYMPVVVTWQNGAPVRISDVATADRQRRERQGRELARTARAPSCSPSTASPTPTPSRSSTGSRRCCRRSRPSCRAGVDIAVLERPLGVDPRRHRRRPVHALPGRRAGRHRHLLLPAQLPRDADPGDRAADLGDRHLRRHVCLRPFDRQHLAAGADARRRASSSTTPSSCSRTSSAISRRARSRWRPPSRAPRKSASPSSR